MSRKKPLTLVFKNYNFNTFLCSKADFIQNSTFNNFLKIVSSFWLSFKLKARMDHDLKKLQLLVEDQITKANAFKSKMSVQMGQLSPDKEDPERPRSSEFPEDAKSDFMERPSSKGVVFDNQVLLRAGMTFSSLPTLTSYSSAKTGRTATEFSENSFPALNREGRGADVPFKITIPKIRKKISQSNSLNSLESVRFQPKNRPTGKIKRVSVHSFPMPQMDDNTTHAGRSVSPQLIHDIGEAFKGIYTRQKLQPIKQQRDDQSPPPPFRSRVRTPPELIADDLTHSDVAMTSFMNSVTGRSTSSLLHFRIYRGSFLFFSLADIQRNFDDTRAFDPNMNMNVRELTTIVNKERSNFDSLSLYVQVPFRNF
jgi:hypothetical protein